MICNVNTIMLSDKNLLKLQCKVIYLLNVFLFKSVRKDCAAFLAHGSLLDMVAAFIDYLH